MKIQYILLLLISFSGQQLIAQKTVRLERFSDSLSYALGVVHAVSLFEEDVKFEDLDKALLSEGFETNLSANDPSECEGVLQAFLGPQGQEFNLDRLNDGSYCIGRMSAFYFYNQMEQLHVLAEIDVSLVMKGFSDGVYRRDEETLSLGGRTKVIAVFSEKLQQDFNKEITERDNAFWENVLTNPDLKEIGNSGLYLEVIKEGTGETHPEATSDFETHYILTNVSGDTLESSYDHGEAIKLNLSQVIQGWQKGIPAMKKGGIYRLYVPWELAYKGGNPQAPQGALVFYIELIDFGPKGTIAKPYGY